MKQKLKQLYELDQKITSLNYSMALLAWDGQTTAPKESVEGRAKAMMTLSGVYFETLINDQTNEILKGLESNKEDLSTDDQAKIKLFRKEYDNIAKIPQKEYEAFSEARALSSAAWEEAKNKDDFNIFAPHLEKMIDFTKRQVAYMEKEASPYDVLLDLYEEGLTMKEADLFFDYLKSEIVPLVADIKGTNRNGKYNQLNKNMAIEKQKNFTNNILNVIGFNKDRGMIGESEHPFTCNMNRNDVRFSVHYYENDFRSAYLSAFHEGGHALYEQDIDKKYANSIVGTGTSMGIHESQSRFYENHIALNEGQLKLFYNELIAKYYKEISNIPFEQFYFEMNKVAPSLVRVEADEVTYPLHIMIRYEIEKMMIEEGVKVSDLPEIWNSKYKEYLGIVPPTNQIGVLQDVHWSEALFGYFPSYALGSAYSAQFYHAMNQSVKVTEEIAKGDLSKIGEWLKNNIHVYGCTKNPAEIIKSATNEDFNPKYYTDYIKEKYKKLYSL